MDISKDGLVRTFEKKFEQAQPIVYSSHIVDKNISLLQKINEGFFFKNLLLEYECLHLYSRIAIFSAAIIDEK